MAGIKIFGDNELLKGAMMFFDKAVGAYILDNSSRPDFKFQTLKNMRENSNLYLTDVRLANPKKGVSHHEADLVGFNENGQAVCFKLRLNEDMKVSGFSKKNIENMSENTKEVANDIKNELGLTNRSPNSR
jgi:hypothetical protein